MLVIFLSVSTNDAATGKNRNVKRKHGFHRQKDHQNLKKSAKRKVKNSQEPAKTSAQSTYRDELMSALEAQVDLTLHCIVKRTPTMNNQHISVPKDITTEIESYLKQD